ncbi:MAG: HAMP domain-containing protein [Anaerolineales bacterium]|nr:HAMP domain-containing protein [Anaerolineales bacterium]
MSEKETLNAGSRVSLRFAAGILLAMAVSLALFYLIMQPQQLDLGLMALFLTITSLITFAAGYLAYRWGWISRAPSLRWALLATYVLSSGLTFLNVWLTAKLMFVNQHDLLLATILLLFASSIAVALGSFFSETLGRRIRALNQAVRGISEKGLGVRAQVEGKDEIADLALAFNQMAQQLEVAEREQQELEKYRRDLVAWVSHDLQTPLASIRAIIEALADDVVDDSEMRTRYLNSAKRDIKALSDLIDDLFQIARLDAGSLDLTLEANSLSDLLSDTLEAFSTLARERGVALVGEVQRDVDPVTMDARRVGRVLSNLIRNALRHTPRAGKISVSAQRVQEGVEVVVRDSGEGISEQDLPHLFDRFYRGEKSRSRATGGVGLGLAIAKGFVEAHGGKIRAEAVPEGGARFIFTLPS